jgi:hypothetical protein
MDAHRAKFTRRENVTSGLNNTSSANSSIPLNSTKLNDTQIENQFERNESDVDFHMMNHT